MNNKKVEKLLFDVHIPQGYQIEIETWENDADHYKKQVLNGLNEEDVWFYQDLLSRFRSVNERENKGFGNTYMEDVLDEELENWVGSVLDEHPDVSEATYNLWSEALKEKEVRDKIIDTLLGYPVDYEYGFLRVFESMTVLYIDEPIVIKKSVSDVTRQFQKASPTPKRPSP